MPAPLLPREKVVDHLVAVFRQLGYEGASLSELSKATGLGRSSLYHYFPGGKEDMANAALARLGEWMEAYLLAPLKKPGTPRERLERVLAALDSLYAQGKEACLLGTLVYGGSRNLFQHRLQESFEAWIAGFEALMIEAGVEATVARQRAESAVIRIQGALILSGGLDDNGPFRRVLEGLSTELLAASGDAPDW